jgi:hypothetical protein
MKLEAIQLLQKAFELQKTLMRNTRRPPRVLSNYALTINRSIVSKHQISTTLCPPRNLRKGSHQPSTQMTQVKQKKHFQGLFDVSSRLKWQPRRLPFSTPAAMYQILKVVNQ